MSLTIQLKRLALTFLILIVSGISYVANAQADAEAGQRLFQEYCTQCHAVNDVVVGPALKGISQRRQMSWIVSFVQNSQKVIKSGDAYAVKLYEQYGRTEMPAFPNLNADDVANIVEFVETYEQAPSGPQKGEDGTQPVEQRDDFSTLVITLVLIVLLLVLLMLVVFLSVIRKYLKDKEASLTEGEKYIVDQKFDIVGALKSRGFITVVVLIFLAIGIRSCWVGLLSIGIDQNYAPTQPIPFSHQQHVGQYNIDCNYCHTGAARGKQAGIPSVNICMNCHSSIKSGPRFGENAIAQVRAAWENNRPIRWVRVHNLPDLAYFNHAQHVTVGGIECQTCHGPIEEMEVVRQHSPLTMGWCINCHRATAVNGKDNAYYDKLYQLHKNPTPMTVSEIGGLECSKCHY